VDDNEFNREVGAELVQVTGAQVDTVCNGQEAVDATASTRYDLVLMDIQMPVMDGYTAAHILRETLPDLPVVALTAHAMAEERQRVLDAGMQDLLTKPILPELLYTALTRQKSNVVILHQGPRGELRKYSSDDRSETARRLTNLFSAPSPITIDGRFFEENLIHRTSRGYMVRSKSEVIIADHLARRNIEPLYEHPLTIDGVTKYPDFTIEDTGSGRDFYWEHCGMLHVPRYRRRWEEKLAWYKSHGIVPYQEGDGSRATLIVTRDDEKGGISSPEIERIIREIILA